MDRTRFQQYGYSWSEKSIVKKQYGWGLVAASAPDCDGLYERIEAAAAPLKVMGKSLTIYGGYSRQVRQFYCAAAVPCSSGVDGRENHYVRMYLPLPPSEEIEERPELLLGIYRYHIDEKLSEETDLSEVSVEIPHFSLEKITAKYFSEESLTAFIGQVLDVIFLKKKNLELFVPKEGEEEREIIYLLFRMIPRTLLSRLNFAVCGDGENDTVKYIFRKTSQMKGAIRFQEGPGNAFIKPLLQVIAKLFIEGEPQLQTFYRRMSVDQNTDIEILAWNFYLEEAQKESLFPYDIISMGYLRKLYIRATNQQEFGILLKKIFEQHLYNRMDTGQREEWIEEEIKYCYRKIKREEPFDTSLYLEDLLGHKVAGTRVHGELVSELIKEKYPELDEQLEALKEKKEWQERERLEKERQGKERLEKERQERERLEKEERENREKERQGMASCEREFQESVVREDEDGEKDYQGKVRQEKDCMENQLQRKALQETKAWENQLLEKMPQEQEDREKNHRGKAFQGQESSEDQFQRNVPPEQESWENKFWENAVQENGQQDSKRQEKDCYGSNDKQKRTKGRGRRGAKRQKKQQQNIGPDRTNSKQNPKESQSPYDTHANAEETAYKKAQEPETTELRRELDLLKQRLKKEQEKNKKLDKVLVLIQKLYLFILLLTGALLGYCLAEIPGILLGAAAGLTAAILTLLLVCKNVKNSKIEGGDKKNEKDIS